jgi:hypothetical protein
VIPHEQKTKNKKEEGRLIIKQNLYKQCVLDEEVLRGWCNISKLSITFFTATSIRYSKSNKKAMPLL